MDADRWVIEFDGAFYWERAGTWAWSSSKWTPFPLKEGAEDAAFRLCIKDPDLIGRVKVIPEREVA